MNKGKLRLKPFRILSALLGAAVLFMLVSIPSQLIGLERQYDELSKAKEAREDAKARQIQLTQELKEVNDDDFIERTARREYGYCWYGETVYRVGNLDELQEAAGFEVYDGQDETAPEQ